MAEIGLGGASYRLVLDGEDPGACDAVISLTDDRTTQELFTMADAELGCGEPHFSIHWAGDLDGDGKLDLVTTFSSKYSIHPRQLYLSSGAEPGDLVALAAVSERTAA